MCELDGEDESHAAVMVAVVVAALASPCPSGVAAGSGGDEMSSAMALHKSGTRSVKQ